MLTLTLPCCNATRDDGVSTAHSHLLLWQSLKYHHLAQIYLASMGSWSWALEKRSAFSQAVFFSLCRPGITGLILPLFLPAPHPLGSLPSSSSASTDPQGSKLTAAVKTAQAQNKEFVPYCCYPFSYFFSDIKVQHDIRRGLNRISLSILSA